jgi:hypothetical protein
MKTSIAPPRSRGCPRLDQKRLGVGIGMGLRPWAPDPMMPRPAVGHDVEPGRLDSGEKIVIADCPWGDRCGSPCGCLRVLDAPVEPLRHCGEWMHSRATNPLVLPSRRMPGRRRHHEGAIALRFDPGERRGLLQRAVEVEVVMTPSGTRLDERATLWKPEASRGKIAQRLVTGVPRIHVDDQKSRGDRPADDADVGPPAGRPPSADRLCPQGAVLEVAPAQDRMLARRRAALPLPAGTSSTRRPPQGYRGPPVPHVLEGDVCRDHRRPRPEESPVR